MNRIGQIPVMNCRPSAAAALVLTGLVPIAQAANAENPTSTHATATATILQATTNDPQTPNKAVIERASVGTDRMKLRFIGPDGSTSNIPAPGFRRLIIIELH